MEPIAIAMGFLFSLAARRKTPGTLLFVPYQSFWHYSHELTKQKTHAKHG
jgi:hypothetical protein